jgi:hypothetical protein
MNSDPSTQRVSVFVKLQTLIREVLGSNLGRDIDCLDWGFSGVGYRSMSEVANVGLSMYDVGEETTTY